METTYEYTRYQTTTVYTTYVIEDRCTNHSKCLAPTLEVHLSCSSSSFDHYTIYPIRFELSPTNQNRPSIDNKTQRASQPAFTGNDKETRERSNHCKYHIFFINREDGSRLIPPSPTAHTPEYSGEKTDLQNDQQSNATCLFCLVLSEPTSRV